MPTASYLIADMQVKLGDPSGAIYTSANLLNWLNEAQKEFCMRVTPLREIDATTIATGVNTFAIPSTRIIFDGIFSRKQIGTKLKALTPTDWQAQFAACPGARGYDSDSWTEMDQTLYVHPAYGTAAASALLSFGETSTATTIHVFSTTGFHDCGRLLTSSGEEIEYAYKSSTAFFGCFRGLASTTAASILKGSRIYQCDLWMVYRKAPVQMTAVTATPEIRSVFHEALEHYAMYLAYVQTGENDKAKMVHQRWEEALRIAEYIESREHLELLSIRDTETQLFNHLGGPR